MAILPSQPGLKVEVLVDESPLKEYDDGEEAPPKTTVKYVEAISGSQFKITCSFTKSFRSPDGVRVAVSLDGNKMTGKLLYNRELFKKDGHTCEGADERINGKWFVRNFRFSQLAIDKDSGRSIDKELKNALASTGEIEVKLFFVKNVRKSKSSQRDITRTQALFGSLPEKAVQTTALSHSGSLDAPREKSTGSASCDYVCDYVDGKDCPFAKFIFRYRSIAALKSLHIVPRTPSPVPLEERPTQDLTPEELLELVNRYRAKEAAAPKIKKELKRERPDDDRTLGNGDEVSVVEERPRKRLHGLPTKDDEVVILD